MKVFWALILSTCLSVMLYNLGNLSYHFYQTPMSTKVKTILVDNFSQIAYCPQGVVGYAEDMKRHGVTTDDIVSLNNHFFVSLGREYENFRLVVSLLLVSFNFKSAVPDDYSSSLNLDC